ncbi:MAG: MOSC domain-containing protein [Arcicella sp.]|nr:MOSC domain-containing protein [Arcicella sp.]
MLKLSEIYIYPVKSLGGIRLDFANITTRGLENDRRFMLVDENGRFLSQREHPQLAIFQTEIEGKFLKITHKKTKQNLTINLSPPSQPSLLSVTIWDDNTTAVESSSEASTWFTQILEIPVRLVYMSEESHRKTDTQYSLTGEEITSFSDGYPILIIGQSSLDDLNNRLENPVNINRFRPNFVFTHGEPFEEDNWHEFTVGNIRFFGVKPCARCIMTTIDQETGEKKDREPLLTLNKYRKAGNKILFGQNVLISQLGTVSVGEDVTVISRKKLAKFEID